MCGWVRVGGGGGMFHAGNNFSGNYFLHYVRFVVSTQRGYKAEILLSSNVGK